MKKYTDIYVLVKDNTGKCNCPYCNTENQFNLQKVGEYTAFPSCRHFIRSVRYDLYGRPLKKGIFATFMEE